MSNKIKDPIWPEDEIELKEVIKGRHISELYKTEFGIDVADEIKVADVLRFYNPKRKYQFYHPLLSGSSIFYQNLYEKMGYTLRKPEFEWAASFVSGSDTVLDVGCGAGDFSNSIECKSYRGIELSEYAVSQAINNGIDVSCETMTSLINRGESYDVVSAFQVIEHVTDPKTFLHEALSLVRPGGSLIISWPSVNSYLSIMENAPLNIPPHHLYNFSLQTVLHMLDKEKIKVQHIEQQRVKSGANFYSVVIKQKLNAILGRKQRVVRVSLVDKLLNKLIFQIARLMPTIPYQIAPYAPTTMVVFRREID